MNYVCIDAGQTKTDIVVFNKGNHIVDKWKINPIIHPAKRGGLDSYRNIVVSLSEYFHHLGTTRFNSICFSLSGFHPGNKTISDVIKQELVKRSVLTDNLYIVPDYIGSWYSATKGKPGIIVISGGGTVAYGKDEQGIAYRMGGWGHLLGDEGSGYWIGLEAIKASLKINNQIVSEQSPLCLAIENALNYTDESDLLQLIYSGQITDEDVAKLVPIINDYAMQGDKVSTDIINRATAHLSQLCMAMINRVGEIPIYLSGGVFKSELIFSGVKKFLLKNSYNAPIQPTSINPIEGLLFIAKRGIQT